MDKQAKINRSILHFRLLQCESEIKICFGLATTISKELEEVKKLLRGIK